MQTLCAQELWSGRAYMQLMIAASATLLVNETLTGSTGVYMNVS
jgi:hypothetical protein